jgi:hypothetical protein
LKSTLYTLLIYEPGSTDVPAATYESSSPFAAISEGDYLHPYPTPDETSGWPELGPQKYLQATEVHHNGRRTDHAHGGGLHKTPRGVSSGVNPTPMPQALRREYRDRGETCGVG